MMRNLVFPKSSHSLVNTANGKCLQTRAGKLVTKRTSLSRDISARVSYGQFIISFGTAVQLQKLKARLNKYIEDNCI